MSDEELRALERATDQEPEPKWGLAEAFLRAGRFDDACRALKILWRARREDVEALVPGVEWLAEGQSVGLTEWQRTYEIVRDDIEAVDVLRLARAFPKENGVHRPNSYRLLRIYPAIHRVPGSGSSRLVLAAWTPVPSFEVRAGPPVVKTRLPDPEGLGMLVVRLTAWRGGVGKSKLLEPEKWRKGGARGQEAGR